MRSSTEHLELIPGIEPFGVSIVIPVYQEGAAINDVVEHIRTIDAALEWEIIVVDGDPGGSTINLIRDESVITRVADKGRAVQMNAGAAVASKEVIVFLHADTFLPRRAVDAFRRVAGGEGGVIGAFSPRFNSSRMIYRLFSSSLGVYTRMFESPFGDQAIFFSRAFFNEIGGYRELSLLEDVEIVRRVKRMNRHVFVSRLSAETSTRRFESEGIVKRVSMNFMIMLLYKMGVRPHWLARWYGERLNPGSSRSNSLP